MTSQPDVVRNNAECVVAGIDGLDSSEPILKIISTGRLKRHSVRIKPRPPEIPPKIAHMSVGEATRVVAETEVDPRLGIKVHHGNQAMRC